jgi:hypothetical protein
MDWIDFAPYRIRCQSIVNAILNLWSSIEANTSSGSKEISRILYNLEAHYSVQTFAPPVPTLSQVSPVHALPYNSLKVSVNITSHLRLALRGGLFPSGFPTKTLYALFLYFICATCPASLILLDLSI